MSLCPNCNRLLDVTDRKFPHINERGYREFWCDICHLESMGIIPEIKGVGKDAPTIETETGGKHSDSPFRLDLVDAKALFEVGKVLKEGAEKYGVDNWRLIDTQAHLNHALVHIYAHLAGDRQDDHLSHAVCRTLFALAVALEGKK